jgi:predicted porin
MKNITGLSIGLCAVALTCTSQSALAQSSVTLYGVLDVFAASLKPTTATKATLLQGSGGMTTSFWGMRGQEDLGGGYKALFAIEGYVLLNSGSGTRYSGDTNFSRNAYVGLSSPYGQVLLGRQTSVVYAATATFNPQGGAFYFSPLTAQLWSSNFGRLAAGDTSWSNVISYTSPNVGGFVVKGAYGLADGGTSAGLRNVGGTVTYGNGPFGAVIGASRVEIGPGIATTAPIENMQFAGLKYDARFAQFFLTYDRTQVDVSTLHTDGIQAGTSIRVGTSFIELSWMSSFESTRALGHFRRDTAGLTYDYPLSKRTDVYAAYLYDRSTLAATGNTLGVGIRASF